MKQTAQKNQSLRIVALFCLAVGVLIVISLLFKGIVLLSKSTFDGQHRYTILQQGNPSNVYSFDPVNGSISVLHISYAAQLGDRDTSHIKIPIDTTVRTDIPFTDTPSKYPQYLFSHYSQLDTSITPIDIFRLWLLSTQVDTANIHKASIRLTENADDGLFDKVASDLFADPTMEKENMSIQVVNGTGVSGEGSQFSRILTNSGANVISIITAHKPVVKTKIAYYGDISYTLEKIEKILGKRAVKMQKKPISDIIITLGQDYKKE